jgi:LysR family transcriptional regulator, hydrogen peroxide-inducible genes activator
MRLPTLKQLQYFLALTEYRHFGHAAEASFVSQSAFSTAIQELEAVLDARLVDRTNRQVTITATGQEVATQARLVVRDAESLVEIAGFRREPLTGNLRLGVIPTIAPFLLPAMLPRLRKAFPRLQLYLVEDQTARLHQRLLDGELDLLLLALPYEMRSVTSIPLFRDGFQLAARRGTKLVDPENYRFSRLNAASVLLLEDGHCLRDHTLAACRIRNTEKVSKFAASSLLTLVEMVDADLGITFLPEMASNSSLLKNTQVRTYATGDKSYRTIGLTWRKGSTREEEFSMLGEFIRNNSLAR